MRKNLTEGGCVSRDTRSTCVETRDFCRSAWQLVKLLHPARWLAAGVLVFLTLSPASGSLSAPRTLTFEDRVKAQEAIERVYYSHQLETTVPFEETVPRAILEDKVTRYLKQSVALDEIWKTPVTAGMLSNEWERIASRTRYPDRLREIYDALGNDSILIQECFVRPALVDRLVRSFFQGDFVLHAEAKARAKNLVEQLRRDPQTPRQLPGVHRGEIELRGGKTASDAPSPFSAFVEPGERLRMSDIHTQRMSIEELDHWRSLLPAHVGDVSVEETSDGFFVRVLTESDATRLRYILYSIPKQPWDEWWLESQDRFDPDGLEIEAQPHALLEGNIRGLPPPAGDGTPQVEAAGCMAADSWEVTPSSYTVPERSEHTAVWTGSLMLVWGGAWVGTDAGMGERYDPLTDTWSPIAVAGAPSNRRGHSAVWTSSEMIIWGGKRFDSPGLFTGGRYNPLSDTWTSMSTIGIPSRTYGQSAIWTGTEMIVFGGALASGIAGSHGGRYNPATDTWTGIPDGGWSDKFFHSAVWTGTRMVIWGGSEGSFATNTGGSYNPETNSWTEITSAGAPPAAQKATAVWTGSRMIVWGGELDDFTNFRSTGGMYDPSTNTWTSTSGTGVPMARSRHSVIWTGSEMIVWGGVGAPSGPLLALNSGGRFDPALNSWSSTNPAAPDPVFAHSAVWTGSRMVVFGGRKSAANEIASRQGGQYNPSTDSWIPTSAGPTLAEPFGGPAAVWTGNLMILWGGYGYPAGGVTHSGLRYDPLLDTLTPTSTLSAPTPRALHTGIWTGSRMVVWGGSDDFGTRFNTGGRYDPVAGTWSATSLSGAPSARDYHSAVWAGDEMIVWGGGVGTAGNPTYTQTGGRYDPIADSWIATTSLAGAPSARSGHTTVWTGNRMIVWGGYNMGFLGNGARYNPNNDQWSTMSTSDAPAARDLHEAVWTGSVMLIWGGVNSVGFFNSGAAYHPQSNSWTTMSLTGAPAARIEFKAVWDGSEMIIWGGRFEGDIPTDTGGRYNPTSDVWTPTALNGAPFPRANHAQVWTGRHMLVAGGNYGLGRYAPQPIDTDDDADGFTTCGGDCNDLNPAVHPGALEICNALDEDCDGSTDEGFPDADQDGVAVCAGDCNDANPSIHPGALEACNQADDDCDGIVDEGFPDADSDGFASCAGDCNEGDPTIHPGATEVCNGVDDDCNGMNDDAGDQDADGVGSCDDCNDANPMVWVPPFEVATLTPSESVPTTLTWDDQSWIGPETVYDLTTGIAGPATGISLGSGSCLQADNPVPEHTDTRPDPALQTAYWYLVRARNSCGAGTYGTNHLGQLRVLPPCP
jgi:N-acetylneuraminic acid mutarotase